jgi:hypothetical protein
MEGINPLTASLAVCTWVCVFVCACVCLCAPCTIRMGRAFVPVSSKKSTWLMLYLLTVHGPSSVCSFLWCLCGGLLQTIPSSRSRYMFFMSQGGGGEEVEPFRGWPFIGHRPPVHAVWHLMRRVKLGFCSLLWFLLCRDHVPCLRLVLNCMLAGHSGPPMLSSDASWLSY